MAHSVGGAGAELEADLGHGGGGGAFGGRLIRCGSDYHHHRAGTDHDRGPAADHRDTGEGRGPGGGDHHHGAGPADHHHVTPRPCSAAVHFGQVTYYAHPAGGCASPWLPFGTVVRVTNPANGESVDCVVNDREADTERSIDLATATFAEIAPLSQGVINAELSW